MLNWKRVVVDGYKEKVNNAAAVYGLAFHKYIDTMYQTGGDMRLARAGAFELFRQPKMPHQSDYMMDEKHLMSTCYRYWDDIIMKNSTMDILMLPDDKPATEVTFRLPYMEDDDFIVNICGTIDRIGKIKGGCFVIRDFKTTGKYNVKEFLDNFRMSKQLRFYVMAIKLMAERYPDSIFAKIVQAPLGACIDGIFLKPSASDNVYQSSNVYLFGEKTIKEFRTVLDIKIRQLLNSLRLDFFPKEGIVTNYCNGEYQCSFWNVCGAPDEMAEVLLKRDFAQKPYDPLAFNKIEKPTV